VTAGQNLNVAGSRAGFTLVELVVVIAVIGVLAALLLPAVQAAREASRRISCSNNLKQIGLALHMYEHVERCLPAGVRHGPRVGSNTTFGISWWVGILPYLEQNALYDTLDQTSAHCGWAVLNVANGRAADGVVISPMLCPTSRLPQMSKVGSFELTRPSYLGIAGATDGAGDPYTDASFPESRVSLCCVPADGPLAASGLLIPNRNVRIAEITDGSSNTLMAGEVSDFANDAAGNNVSVDGSFPNGWLMGTLAAGTPNSYHPRFSPPSYNITTIRYPVGTRDATLPGIKWNQPNHPLISSHPGGAMVAYADASVSFLSQTANLRMLKQLATRDDGQVVHRP
jgi:prepilin-type N-terminal cleavage/methylation domain-containing protein/prepilin-type processing-associated H-X9-DG protein